MKYTKRPDGRFASSITLTDHLGNKKRYFIIKRTEKEVDAEIERLKSGYKHELGFSEAADLWMAEHEKEIRYNTMQCYLSPVADCKEFFGNAPMSSIKPSRIQQFLNGFVGLKRQTIKLRKIVLNLIFRWYMVNYDDVSVNPTEYTKPNGLAATKREMPTGDTIRSIINNQEDKFGRLIFFYLSTGCRKAEALAINWDDVDFDKRLIRISKEVEFHSNSPEIVERTKTSAGTRFVVMTNELAENLQKIKSNGLVFHFNHRPYTRGQYESAMRKYRKLIGVESLTAHELRHAHTAYMKLCGVNPETVKNLEGHSSIKVTYDIYDKFLFTQYDEAKEKIDKVNIGRLADATESSKK